MVVAVVEAMRPSVVTRELRRLSNDKEVLEGDAVQPRHELSKADAHAHKKGQSWSRRAGGKETAKRSTRSFCFPFYIHCGADRFSSASCARLIH